MSLFVVTVPTREHELSLRKKELVIQNAIHVSETSSPTGSVDLSNTSANQLKYMALTGGRPMEIIVSDDFMEIKEQAADPGSSFSALISPQLLDDEKIQAQIEKYFLEKHLEDTLDVFGITNATWTPTFGGIMSLVEFTTSANVTDTIIKRFQSVGIGSKYESTLTVLTATVYYGPTKFAEEKRNEDDEEEKQGSGWSDFVQSIKARLTVAQVVSQIRSMTVLNFDFLMFVIVAALIACLGLLENNSVILVASMLISPLMGPIMAFTFASVIRDIPLLKTGIKSEIIGLSICLFVGFGTGCCMESEAFHGPWYSVDQWPTKEMIGRGQWRSLIVGVLMAVPSGIGVALSVLAGNAGSLVGVAIAASLLPPAVNCGLFWGLAFVIWVKDGARNGKWKPTCGSITVAKHSSINYAPMYCNNIIYEYSTLGIMSFGLTVVNIVVIFIVAVLILKIKEVAPYTTRQSLRRFWKEDVAMAREYNGAHLGQDMRTGILRDLDQTDNPDEVKKKLDQDQVFRQVNRRIIGGGGGDNTLLNNYKRGESNPILSDIELPRSRKQNEGKQDPRKSSGGWFGWFGSSSAAAKSKYPLPRIFKLKGQNKTIAPSRNIWISYKTVEVLRTDVYASTWLP
ncbi:unnamed protein product [Allacma fusca]|uniref:Uncharacterized protein n=1 Tax=Allacma fusca TaxID=39272 RepID=A0A8J2J626_9HEXA|nr:unnamed protein product [Allacma fusca]